MGTFTESREEAAFSMFQKLLLVALLGVALADHSAVEQPTLARGIVGPRIVGGREAEREAWPWQVSLGFLGFHNCGGVLVDEQWVLTAAHCVESEFLISVVLGMHDTWEDEEPYIQWLDVEEYYLHPNFSNNPSLGFPNDIALLKLEAAADTNRSNIATARLPSSTDKDYYNDKTCIITGWGLENGDDWFSPDKLMEADVDVLSESRCSELWSGTPISDPHICVYDKENQTTSACNGDSGGPLNCQVNGEWEVAGVTSWGIRGCDPKYPSVYARISTYLDWINGIMSKYSV